MDLKNIANDNGMFAHQTICDNRWLKPVACEILFREYKGKTINDFSNDPSLFVLHLDDLVKGKALAIKSLYDTHDYKMFFINFTPDQIASPGFIHALRWFDLNGVHASNVIIEVTELFHNTDNNSAFIQNVSFLRRKGHLIAIDDFGSGYSNFDRILLLQPQVVKIDQNLLRLSSLSKEHNQFLQTLVSFLHKVGSKCVVEGVEDDKLLTVAQKSGADYLQGYHLSRPILIADSPKHEPLKQAHNTVVFGNMGCEPSYSF